MKYKILITLMFGFVSTTSMAIQTPTIPDGWKLLVKAEGDLNNDGQSDLAMVIEKIDPALVRKSEVLSGKQLNTNPRKLKVYLSNTNKYLLVSTSDKLIPSEATYDQPCEHDPFEEKGMEISNGMLKFGFVYLVSCGSWSVPSTEYKFRYTNSKFMLVEYTSTFFNRATASENSYKFNLLSAEEIIIKNEKNENGEFVENETRIKLKPQEYLLGSINQMFCRDIEGSLCE